MTATTPSFIQRALWWLFGVCSFNRIAVHDRPVLPTDCGVLYLGLHRNGALDGVAYLQAAPNAAFLVSAQLHRFRLGRFLFPGIAVARTKDRVRGIAADNVAGFERCVEHLATDGELFIMPEGTSSLGPRHLPFKPGAARIATEVLARNRSLVVVPVAVHYECAWEWQSRVEVVFGRPLTLSPEVPETAQDVAARFATALEETGINVDTIEELRFIEMLAYGATLGTDLRYDHCLKRFEHGVPEALRAEATALAATASDASALLHQGIPLTPIGATVPYLLIWLLLAPLMFAFAALNFPALVAGALAARKLSDDINVVAFWRAIVGVPVALLWGGILAVVFWLFWGISASLAYIGLSILSLRLFYRFRKLSVAAFNCIAAPQLKRPLLAFQKTLFQCLGHD